MSNFLYGSICVTDIPKDFITTGKNGKKYLNINISERREISAYGDSHNITINVPKDQKKQGDKPIYIGNLKTWVDNNANNTQPADNNPHNGDMPTDGDDDLPF